ncbi:MAG: CHRD domain-containing protein [Pirellulales bacterium]
MIRRSILFSAIVAGLCCAPHATAATILFDILLDGLQETPPVATTGIGSGSLTLDDLTGDYTISGTFSDLLGTSNNAHIHGPAAVGVGPAGVIVGLIFDFGVTSGAFSGAGTFTAPQMADLLAELYYVNIHSSIQPGGEIRGQITQVPEPASVVLMAVGGLALTAVWRARRRRTAA